MSEPAGAAAVGIETVQCSPESGGHLTIRVTGRWRRPITAGRPTLVIEADGRRHCYPAMAEPPSLAGAGTGTGPGVWRLRFTVPEGLASGPGRSWLQFGSVFVTLPIPVPAGGEGRTVQLEAVTQPPEPIDRVPLAPPALVLADDAARGGLESRVAELERELDEARTERDELVASLAERERRRRIAEQRAHADQAAAAALVTRERAEHSRRPPALRRPSAPVPRLPSPASEPPPRASEPPPLVPEPPPRASEPPPLVPEPPRVASGSPAPVDRDALIETLRRELDSRARADAGLRARAIDAETRLAARVLLEQRTTAALAQVRTELETLCEALEHERELRRDAERRDAEHRDAEQRDDERRATQLEREPVPAPAASAGPLPVEPERLTDALTRLRSTVAPQTPPAGDDDADPTAADPTAGSPPPVRRVDPTEGRLEPAFRRLVRHDPDAAGRLLLELLPLAPLVHPRPAAYDLVLGRRTGNTCPCVCVTVFGGAATIRVRRAPRPVDQVDFQAVGEPVRIARLLVAGWLRRRFRLGVARVRGRREQLAALSALLHAPLNLTALHREGARLDSATTFALVAAMIDPAWTAGQQFTLAHEESHAGTTYVSVSGGRRIQVAPTAPTRPITTTLRCRADLLPAVLCGEPVSGLTVTGDPAPLAWLRRWINRAQSE